MTELLLSDIFKAWTGETHPLREQATLRARYRAQRERIAARLLEWNRRGLVRKGSGNDRLS